MGNRGLSGHSAILALAIVAGAVVAPALAAPPEATTSIIAIPAGPLAEAIGLLARQTGVDIGGNDPALTSLRTAGVTGRQTPASALARLLRDTPLTFETIGPASFRIVRRPARVMGTAPPPSPPPPPLARAGAAPVGDDEIVITGGKRDIPLARYPGSATVLVPVNGAGAPHGTGGQDWLLARTAILQSTELGSGRNKLFIRGVADSSFTGPTQATAGTYFGDVRVGYNGPDPNLNLYDVERIEILEGPQGTLYGAGSIGGIIRLEPAAPDPGGAAATIDVGGSATHSGGLGYDAAAMINVAPWRDRIGVRAVVYRSVDAGYIDDSGRGLKNVNRQLTSGARLAVRVAPLDGWTIDGGIVLQSSRQPDLQYATTGAGLLQRASAIGQPFEDDYQLIRGGIAKRWSNGLSLTASYGRVSHTTDQRYDVTRPGQTVPIAYDERNDIHFNSYEVRLAQTLASGFGWVFGASSLMDRTEISRTFGPLAATRDLVGVTNRTADRAVYGELTVPLSHAFSLTGGVRYTSARMDGEPSINPVNRDFIRGQTSQRFDPQAGFAWKLARRIVAFGQYQQGFRTGGLAVARGVGRVAAYDADSIRVGEVGLRLLRGGERGISAVVAASVTRWTDIQADLVSRGGFPYTANVGDGRIEGVEGTIDWAIGGGLRATAAMFYNHSVLVDPAPDFVSSGARPLPATPALTGTGLIEWRRDIGWGALRLAANARYISHSRLGVGPVLDLRYGDYVQTGLSASIARGPFEGSLSVQNVLGTVGNRFAIGNPFGVQYRDEYTPLRPRTIRMGVSGRF